MGIDGAVGREGDEFVVVVGRGEHGMPPTAERW
jgi:hypothetical protein